MKKKTFIKINCIYNTKKANLIKFQKIFKEIQKFSYQYYIYDDNLVSVPIEKIIIYWNKLWRIKSVLKFPKNNMKIFFIFQNSNNNSKKVQIFISMLFIW